MDKTLPEVQPPMTSEELRTMIDGAKWVERRQEFLCGDRSTTKPPTLEECAAVLDLFEESVKRVASLEYDYVQYQEHMGKSGWPSTAKRDEYFEADQQMLGDRKMLMAVFAYIPRGASQ